METPIKFLFVAIGGALGAISRYGVGLIFANTLSPFPFATFLINISGSFLIGLLLAKFEANEGLRLLFITGFLGSYTTFSTLEYETFELTQSKHLFMAFAYTALSFAIGFIGVWIGVIIGRKL